MKSSVRRLPNAMKITGKDFNKRAHQQVTLLGTGSTRLTHQRRNLYFDVNVMNNSIIYVNTKNH